MRCSFLPRPPRTLSPRLPAPSLCLQAHSCGAGPLSRESQESPLRDRSLSISLCGAVLVFLELLLLSLASFKGAQECPPPHCFYIPISAQWRPGLPDNQDQGPQPVAFPTLSCPPSNTETQDRKPEPRAQRLVPVCRQNPDTPRRSAPTASYRAGPGVYTELASRPLVRLFLA